MGKVLSSGKKIDVEILMNLHVLRSQEYEKEVFKKCRVYSILCDGCCRRKYTRDYDETLDRTEMRFFGVLFNKRLNGG